MRDVSTNESPPTEATDAVLLLRIAQRERQALEQLYDRYGAKVGGWALLVQPDPTCSEEIIIETFWYVWKHASKLRSSSANVETALKTIVAWAAAATKPAAPEPKEASSLVNPLRKSDEQERRGIHNPMRLHH